MSQKIKALELQPIERQGDWQAYLLPVSAFPTPKQELWTAKSFLTALVGAARKQWGLNAETFIQVFELHIGDGADLIAANGAAWVPTPGLGVWPDRKGPRFWTIDDFAKLLPDQTPPTLIHNVMHVSKGDEVADHVRDTLLGGGAVLQMLTKLETDKFLEAAKSALLPKIDDPSFQAFPLFVPLLERSSVAAASDPQLEEWTCGAELYIRESTGDKGILILSRQGLESTLSDLGATPAQGKPDGTWNLPA